MGASVWQEQAENFKQVYLQIDPRAADSSYRASMCKTEDPVRLIIINENAPLMLLCEDLRFLADYP